jgi:hypothetical protein
MTDPREIGVRHETKQHQRYLIRGAVALISCGGRIMHAANHPSQGRNMKSFFLFLAIVSAGCLVVFLTAANEPNWASDLYGIALSICDSPQQLIYAAAGLAALCMLPVFVSMFRN